jgi:hypothetical protein
VKCSVREADASPENITHCRTSSHYAEHFTDEAQTALFKDPVRTAQYTLFFSVIKTNQFML